MIDTAHKKTDQEIALVERRLKKEYAKAEKEVQEKLDDYFARYEKKDKKWRQWVEDGKKTDAEYKKWRTGQLAVGDRWKAMRDTVAQDYANVNRIARDIVHKGSFGVYALNHNYATYQIEHDAGLNTLYTLYSRDTVAYLVSENPQLLPDPGDATQRRILNGLDVRYNRQQIQSAMLQGILQGEDITKMAGRLAKQVGEKNEKAAIRNARTAYTCAQNKGRLNAYRRAENMGIDLMKTWVAVMDGRTRHAHRLLDGQTVPVNEPFDSEFHDDIMFPGDPEAEPGDIYNCRCTMTSSIKGYEIDTTNYRQDPGYSEMSYEEWEEGHEYSNPITLPKMKAAAIKGSYIKRYKQK